MHIARAKRKRGLLSTECDVDEALVKKIQRKSSNENLVKANPQPNIQVASTFNNFFAQMRNQTSLTTNNAYSKPRPILPRAPVSSSNKLPIFSHAPVLLSPVTTISLNPVTTVPVLIKLEPVNAVTVESSNTGKQISLEEENIFRCSLCSATLQRENDLRRHVRLSHTGTFDSSLSDNTEMPSCHYCGYRCKRKYDIKRHIVCMHLSVKSKPAEDERLMCSICERSFSNKTTLRQHVMKLHFNNTDKKKTKSSPLRYYFCCDICHEAFYTQKYLLAHHDVVHSDTAPISWFTFRTAQRYARSCEKCGKHYEDNKFWEHSCVSPDEATVRKMKNAINACPIYKCDICSLCFSWKLLYRQHRESTHPDAAAVDWNDLNRQCIPNYCSSCFLALDTDEKSADHQCADNERENNLSKSHTCSLCFSSYGRKSDFYRHLRNKHPSELDNHEDMVVRRKAPQSINCPYCEEMGTSRASILKHVKTVHNTDIETPFICVPCNKMFKRKTTMDAHNQIYHPREQNEEETDRILKESEILLNGEKAFHCNICNRNMFDSLRFLAHYRLHNVERKFTCDFCGKQTRTQHQLNSHIKFIHLNVRNYECDICRKSFHAKQSCEEHRRIHTGERPFSCEICGKTFVAMNALFTHQKFHNDFYAHSCHLCPKKFKIRRSLVNHIRTHTGERPFKCDLCSKTFNNSSRFSYHKRVTHSDNRPFTCSQCGSCFKANKFLMRHLKLHDVRQHIQFRRRNNPAYFATQKPSGGGKSSGKKKQVESSEDAQDVCERDNVAVSANKAVDELVENVFIKEENCIEMVESD